MSSLRNAVKRVTHKERSQPQARAHLGILEKKKDYRVRAKEFHKKQDRMQQLRLKASMRNPDEFYFGMKTNQVTMVDGHHRKTMQAQRKERELEIGPDAVRIMKDQDLSYIRMQKQLDMAKVEKLQANLHFLKEDDDDDDDNNNNNNNNNDSEATKSKKRKRKHTIFVDTAEEAKSFNVAEHFGTVPQLANRAFNRPRIETLRQSALATVGLHGATGAAAAASGADQDYEDEDGDDQHGATTTTTTTTSQQQLDRQRKLQQRVARKVRKGRAAAYGELETRLKRVATLERAEAHITTEKLVAAKGRKRKIQQAEDGKPAQYKWRRKRQS